MSSSKSKVVSLVDVDTRAEQMFELRLSGMSVRKIAKQFGVSEAEAQKQIEAQCTPLSVQMRKHVLELELDKLDEMEAIYYPKMKEQQDNSTRPSRVEAHGISGRSRRPSRGDSRRCYADRAGRAAQHD